MLSPASHLSKQITADQLCYRLARQYGEPQFDFALRDSVRNLEHAFGQLSECQGKRILDLGCGAERGASEVNDNPGTWAPWLPRAVAELGGQAVGVDIGIVSSSEKFEFHRLDLRRQEALECFADGSFDAINCTNLLSSSDLVYRQTRQDRSLREAMKDILEKQIERLLRPGGIIIAFDTDLDNH